MVIVALETSLAVPQIAVVQSGQVVRHDVLGSDRRSAQTLVSGIAQLTSFLPHGVRDIELVAVSDGPGSFTGLRVGVTVAKTMAYALGCPLVAVNTLEVIAHQAHIPASVDGSVPVYVILNAQRRQFFAQGFRRSSGRRHTINGGQFFAMDRLFESLPRGALLTGPALEIVDTRRLVREGFLVSPPETWLPSAVTVAHLAARRFAAGETIDPWSLVPTYMRPSYAEEASRRE